MRANRVIASVDVVQESLVKNRHVGVEALGEQQAASAQLSQSKAATMPRGVRLCLAEQIVELFDDLIGEVLGESLRDPSETFGSRPPNDVVLVLQCLEQELDDRLQLIEVDVVLIKHLLIVVVLGSRLGLVRLHEMRERPGAALVPPRRHLGLEEDTADALRQLDLVLPDDGALGHELIRDLRLQHRFKDEVNPGEEVITVSDLEYLHEGLQNATDPEHLLSVLLALGKGRSQVLEYPVGLALLDHVRARQQLREQDGAVLSELPGI